MTARLSSAADWFCEGDFDVAGDVAAEIFGDDRIVGELRDVEGEDGAAVEGLVEVNESAEAGTFAGVAEFLVMQIDEILHHVFDGFRAGIDGVDFEAWVAHADGGEFVDQAVIIETFRRKKIGVGGFVVGRDDQFAEIFGFAQARVIVGDEF